MTRYLAFMLCLAFTTDLGAATVSDVSEAEKGSPTQIEDAYPLEYKELDVEGLFRYERLNDEHRFVLSPRLEYGIAPNWQVRLTSTFFAGTADTTGTGDLQAEVLRNFTTETRWTPALAVSVEGDFPTGHHAYGIDVTVRLLASKTLGSSSALPQVHLNLAWTHHGGRLPDERRHLYDVIVGVSRLLTPQTMVIADYFHQQLTSAGRAEDVVELGVRQVLFGRMIGALGVGYGLTSDSRDFHVQSGIEVTFR